MEKSVLSVCLKIFENVRVYFGMRVQIIGLDEGRLPVNAAAKGSSERNFKIMSNNQNQNRNNNNQNSRNENSRSNQNKNQDSKNSKNSGEQDSRS